MGGDQGNGLALAILIVMAMMVLGGVALFAFAGRALARNLAPRRRGLATVLTALAGAGLGWLLVMATFYESSWSPPPRLHLASAPGPDVPVVILLEDPRAARTLAWRGGWLPFTAATAQIDVPANGIVRVRSFGAIAGRANPQVTWPDGRRSPGTGGGYGPPGIGAETYLVIERPGARTPVLLSAGPATVGLYIVHRERAR